MSMIRREKLADSGLVFGGHYSFLPYLGVDKELRSVTSFFNYLSFRIDEFNLGKKINKSSLKAKLKNLHRKYIEPQTEYCAPRRKILDPLLLKGAQRSGTQFLGGHKFKSIGINTVYLLNDNETVSIKADFIVGTDGRNSALAKFMDQKK